MKLLFVFTLLACVLTATPARADALFIKGATSPAEENVLFNQPGLISTGNTVQGRTELTNLVLNFTFFQGRLALTTTSPGEPRIDAPGFVFNSLRVSDSMIRWFLSRSWTSPSMPIRSAP